METLVKFETAKLAKNKGLFKNEVITLYELNQNTTIVSQSSLQKRLREKGYHIEVCPSKTVKGYTVSVYTTDNNKYFSNLGGLHSTYEEALEFGLREALKLIQ